MPAAMGSCLTTVTRPRVRLRIGGGKALQRRVDEVAAGDGGSVGAGHFDGGFSARIEGHAVADGGEGDQAFEQVVAVGAPPQHTQREVNLGARAFGDRRHRFSSNATAPEEGLPGAA